MSWTAWKDMNQTREHDGDAVFTIRMVKGGRAVRLPRFLGTDPDGILAIGYTANLESRRREFLRGLNSGKGSAEAELLHIVEVYSIFNQTYRNAAYEIRFSKVPTRHRGRRLEQEIMKAYVKTFGEVPPLNSTLPGRRERHGW